MVGAVGPVEVDAVLVRELMTRDVRTIAPETALGPAVRLLAELRVTMLPVVDPDGRVVGVLSEADVLRRYVTADPRAHLRPPRPTPTAWPRSVDDVMTRGAGTSAEGADVADVAREMAEHGWKSVPVVDDDGRLVGLLSRSDIIAAMATSDGQIEQEVVHELALVGCGDVVVTVADGVVTVSGASTPAQGRLVRNVVATAHGVRGIVMEASAPDR